MKKIIILTGIVIIAFHLSTKAQALFVAKGKIEFEKKVNVWKDIDSWSEDGDGRRLAAANKKNYSTV